MYVLIARIDGHGIHNLNKTYGELTMSASPYSDTYHVGCTGRRVRCSSMTMINSIWIDCSRAYRHYDTAASRDIDI